MDIGTMLLLIAVGAGLVDMAILLAGPRIENYEFLSLIMAGMGSLASIGAVVWMGGLIFGNQFQYEYVFLTTKIEASWFLKISALWAGQSGSLVFWAALSFLLYMAFRVLTRGYEDDSIVYRAAIFVALQTILITANAIASDPFRLSGDNPANGLGLNPLLSTVWNVIHPPIVFIAYALTVIPFAVKLAGFTVRSEERNSEPIPVLETFTRFITVTSWIMLSVGIAIGGYWAYIVLGWGGYWAWDPVETTSLVPWLLLTGYYHAKAVLKNNDVLRDSFLVFAYLTVIYATWVTRSGVLNSVHGFSISVVSWTMFATVVANFVVVTLLTVRAGYIDMKDEDDDGGLLKFFSLSNVRNLSVKIALIGILIVTATSVIGVVLPAGINLSLAITDPVNFQDNMISVGIEFFRAGFYVGSLFLVVSAFYCMRSTIISIRKKSLVVLTLLMAGVALAILSISGATPMPTNYWPANLLIPAAIGGVIFLVVAFVRTIAGREGGKFTMRRMGRLMLHLGLIMLLVGVFASENVVHETSAAYQEGYFLEVAPGIEVQVTDIDLVWWNHEYDFYLIATVQVVENGMLVGVGFATIQGNPQWSQVSHQVYVQSSAFRDVFIAVRGFQQVAPGQMQVTLGTKVLPLVSFVWLGPFLMVMALVPVAVLDGSALRAALRSKEQDLYGEVEDESSDAEESIDAEAQ